jgi:hypothetical protein
MNILEYKNLQRMLRKFPSIQQNRQNVILFRETIHLINDVIRLYAGTGMSIRNEFI